MNSATAADGTVHSLSGGLSGFNNNRCICSCGAAFVQGFNSELDPYQDWLLHLDHIKHGRKRKTYTEAEIAAKMHGKAKGAGA